MIRAADFAGTSCRFIKILDTRSRVSTGGSRSSNKWIAARLHCSDNSVSLSRRNSMRLLILFAVFLSRESPEINDWELSVTAAKSEPMPHARLVNEQLNPSRRAGQDERVSTISARTKVTFI